MPASQVFRIARITRFSVLPLRASFSTAGEISRDISRHGDQRGSVEHRVARCQHSGVELFDHLASAPFGRLFVDQVIEECIVAAQLEPGWEDGDLLAFDEFAQPPVGIVGLPETLQGLSETRKVVELAASDRVPNIAWDRECSRRHFHARNRRR